MSPISRPYLAHIPPISPHLLGSEDDSRRTRRTIHLDHNPNSGPDSHPNPNRGPDLHPDPHPHPDQELLTQSCRALAALGEARGPSSAVNTNHIQSLIESNCLPRVVSLMGRAGVELPKAALRVCANVATGDDAQAQAVVDAGALPAMRELLKQPDKVRARG